MKMIETSERRRQDRFSTKDKVFLTFRPDFDRLGIIKDVSSGGISFEYMPLECVDCPQRVEVDIFSEVRGFYLSRVPCRIVYDVDLDGLNGSGHLKRCGLEFMELSPGQNTKIDYFLNHFTMAS